MAELLLDTGVLISAERGRDAAAELAAIVAGRPVSISVVTASELLHGVHRASGAIRTKRAAFVEGVLAAMAPLPIDEPVARLHARLGADLAERGETIGTHDLWIAATAALHDLEVVTTDPHEFTRIEGLKVASYPTT